MPKLSSDPRKRALEEKCIADVAQYGLHVIRVPEDEHGSSFAYTVGLLRTFGHPELIILGLPLETMHVLLNHAADLIRGGHQFAAGDLSDALLQGYACTFRIVPERHHSAFLGWALWFNDAEKLRALQLIYPDQEGRWPSEAGVAEGFQSLQPVLETEPVPQWVG